MFTFSKNEIHTDISSILEKGRKNVLAHRNVNINKRSIFTKEDEKETLSVLRKSSHKRLSMFINVSKNIPVISRQEIAYLTGSKWGKKSTSMHNMYSQMLQ